MVKGWRAWLALAGMAVLAAGCTPKHPREVAKSPGAQSPGAGTDTKALRFWHTQTQENEKALKAIVADYNQQPGVTPVQADYIGNYDALYEKIRAAAASRAPGVLPDLAVAYESMIADYMEAKVVVPLDDYASAPDVGFDAAALDDIFPAYLNSNRFAKFDNQLLSFPFTKSNLVLYYNASLLAEVHAEPPATWDELLADCRALKAKHPGLSPFSTYVDASAFDGVILSMGGTLLQPDGLSGFGSPGALKAVELYTKLFKEKLATQTDKGQQINDFANGKCAFFLRSSTAAPDLGKLIGDKFKWGARGLPTAEGVKPVTVMYGANICVFRSRPEREMAAWKFIKYFASTEVTARWAMASGYLPVRKSAAETKPMQDVWAKRPQSRQCFDALSIAVPEPNVAGWQNVRKCLESAQTSAINGLATPDKVVKELEQCANAALKKAQQQPKDKDATPAAPAPPKKGA